MSKNPSSEARSCPICGSEKLKVYLNGSRHSLDQSAFGSSRTDVAIGRILRCTNCSFGFTETRPSESQLRQLYGHLDASVYESETAGRRRTAQRHLKILRRYASHAGRLLDVGCASARFVVACVEAGWSVVGLEPSEALSAEATKVVANRAQIVAMTLEDADFAPSSFDVVTMWDVLEHVSDPAAFFQRAASLVKPGGLLLINVPNLDSLAARILRRRWPLLLPEHLNYFNLESLRACARCSGVELLAVGSRPVSFTVKYILYRLSQHIPVLSGMARLLSAPPIANRVLPVRMGELYAVWGKCK